LYTAILLVVDFKLVVITKSWTWLNVVALTVLSIFLYLPYVFIADKLPDMFYITYTASIVFGSPLAYLLWFLFVGIFVLADVFFSLMDKEWNTSLHTLYNSIQHREGVISVKEYYETAVKWHKKRLRNMIGLS
jgi:hypothetical protein